MLYTCMVYVYSMLDLMRPSIEPESNVVRGGRERKYVRLYVSESGVCAIRLSVPQSPNDYQQLAVVP